MKTLKEVRKYLNNIPFINEGGCALAALAMKRWLVLNNKNTKNTKFIYDYSWFSEEGFKENKKYLKGKVPVPTSCSHAYLVHNNKIMDSEFEYDKIELRSKNHTVNEKFIVKSLNNFKNWNTLFNRNNIPIIMEDLGIDLSDIHLIDKKYEEEPI